ncbi:MAG TPA: hypothetical protein ENG83_15925 [Nitrospirae bacterium]|nr:hypothetical protein [Nitrospirota bacterium]HDZ02913.1 hypothetical protein [Nitrospirota bacterium]
MRNSELRTLNFELIITALICGLSIFMMSSSVYADSVEEIRVIKISPQDERAVIKTSGRKLRIIKVGDVITIKPVLSSKFSVQSSENKKESSTFKVQSSELKKHVPGAGFKKRGKRSELRVVEIAAGRVVFEEMTDEGLETVIIRLDDDSSKFGVQSSKVRKQRIERIRKTADKQPLLYKPRGIIKRDKTTDGDNTKRSKYQNSSEYKDSSEF